MFDKVSKSLTDKGYNVVLADSKEQALEQIKSMIPSGSSLNYGSSITLEQIGFQELLQAKNHSWVNLHDQITAENDKSKRDILRKQLVHTDFYLGSVHALLETGEFLIASNSASQLPQVASTSPNLIFVVGSQKIVKDLDSGFKRLNEVVIPLEDQRLMKSYNIHTFPSKILIFNREPEFTGRKIHFVLVKESLGY